MGKERGEDGERGEGEGRREEKGEGGGKAKKEDRGMGWTGEDMGWDGEGRERVRRKGGKGRRGATAPKLKFLVPLLTTNMQVEPLQQYRVVDHIKGGGT